MLSLVVVVLVGVAELTWYNPSFCSYVPPRLEGLIDGSVNCYDPTHWWKMAAGDDARLWINRGAACPVEFPIGTKFIIDPYDTTYSLPSYEWECRDRGSSVVIYEDGRIHLDLLTNEPIWRDVVDVEIFVPSIKENKTNGRRESYQPRRR